MQTRERSNAERVWPAFEELQARLEGWRREHLGLFSLEEAGTSLQGRPVYAATLTDPDADAEAKEHVLITALHSGIERSAVTSVFYLMGWLLSGEPLAREVLRRQAVTFMPVVNPDGYVAGTHVNAGGLDPYTAWMLDGPRDPERTPEAVAVRQVMDRLEPEVHADIHGLDLGFRGYLLTENSGASFSNPGLRPYHAEIIQRMDEAALEEGYPSDRLESDAERIPWGSEVDAIRHKTWIERFCWGSREGRLTQQTRIRAARPYAALYAYNRFHSLILASEVAWERSGFLRHRRLLQVGNEVWPGEHASGYPTRVIDRNLFHSIVAYGQTAAERRRSRVELWNAQGQIVHGTLNPQTEGVLLYACATSLEDAEHWFGDNSLDGFLGRARECASVDAEAVGRAVESCPRGAGQWGAQPNLFLTGANTPGKEPKRPIEHGIAFRVSVPYPNARILDLRLNGHPLPESETEGFLTWQARGFTFVQVNVSPERARRERLFIVTWRYDPGERRPQGVWQYGRAPE